MARMSGGQSYTFYLITTGLPIDPTQGSLARYYYSVIVGAIGLQADILFENVIRIVPNISINTFLPGYTSNPRNAYQFLIGLSEYSNPFTRTTLINAIQDYALIKVNDEYPEDGAFCFDPIATLDVTSSFNISRAIGGVWLSQKFNTYYSNTYPTVLDGDFGSIWIVNTNGQLRFLIKDQNAGWSPISDFGNVNFTAMTPPVNNGDWWIDPNNFIFRLFNASTKTWGSPISYLFSQSAPVTGTFWLAAVNSYTLEVRELINTVWESVSLSANTVIMQSDNSNFLSEFSAPTLFNYTLDVEPDALYGGPIGSGNPNTMETTYDRIAATGGANESFTNFFTHVPFNGLAEVFVNGELQDPLGVVISGQNLSFIDSVNGFSLAAGDDVVAFYQYAT